MAIDSDVISTARDDITYRLSARVVQVCELWSWGWFLALVSCPASKIHLYATKTAWNGINSLLGSFKRYMGGDNGENMIQRLSQLVFPQSWLNRLTHESKTTQINQKSTETTSMNIFSGWKLNWSTLSSVSSGSLRFYQRWWLWPQIRSGNTLRFNENCQ